MSYRVIKQTEIKDARLAKEALRLAGLSYREEGSRLVITSGDLNRVTIDLTTGVVTGDTDFHGQDGGSMGLLRQHYGEAQCREVALKQGINIERRAMERVDGEQCVVLYCRQG